MNELPIIEWMETTKNQPERPTIGFLTANIHIGASRVLWPGVLDAALSGNANLICYPGGRLHASADFEAQRNILYHLPDTEQLDGLISWTSALTDAVVPAEVIDLHQRYAPLPIVTLGSPQTQGPSVTIDGYQGMRALIFHLVEVHDYRRIALIRGPEGHPYALERYHAYLEALKEKGLSVNPDLITPSVSWENGAEVMNVLLNERHLKPGIDFQAIVAASDLLAIGALSTLTEHGIRVPADVAVVGFNDIEEGRLVRPPLTSVSLPFYEQGRRSVDVLLAGLTGADVPKHVILESQLLVRQSCGCPSQSINLAAERTTADMPDLKIALQRAQEKIVAQIGRVINNKGVAATWAKQLIDTFHREIQTKSHGQFRSTLDGMLQQGTLDGDETSAWQDAISVLRSELLPALDAQMQLRAEDLFGQARVVIGDAVQRAQIARQVQAERQNRILRDIGQALITAFDVDKLADVLAESLPALGIESCYLALYENPSNSFEWSRLVLAYTQGHRADLEVAGQRFRSCQLVPPDLLPAQRYTFLVEPLYFQADAIGFIVFEVGPRDGGIYEVLRGHISSALKGALLFREAHEARVAAERADTIKTRLLANVSHELRTPLNIIIGHTQRILDAPPLYLAQDLAHIQHSAEHQLRLINDLLDLSRAEINALDLYPVLLDPKSLLEEAFAALAGDAAVSGEVTWRLMLPAHLPIIAADPVRLQQILFNLLSNAAKFTERGQIVLGAEMLPPHLHIWVADSGIGIPPEMVEYIYEPFFTYGQLNRRTNGIGLGLAITQHLVALHQGSLTLESQPGEGSIFHVYLPLPDLHDYPTLHDQSTRSTLWVISDANILPPEIINFSQNQHQVVQQVRVQDDVEALLSTGRPILIAWDMTAPHVDDWLLMRRLHNHPQLSQIPFVLYQQQTEGKTTAGLTSLVVKPASSQALWQAIRPTLPEESAGSILIIDDDPRARKLACDAISQGLPDYTLRTAENGIDGLTAMYAERPSLVILDLMMPGMDGFAVLDQMRADERTISIPVVILSGRQLSLSDVQRLEQHTAVTLQSKGILSSEEIIASLNRVLFDDDMLPPQTSALVKRAIAYLHQNFARPLTRREIAEDLGMNEDYLSRVFNQELGISPWDYLNRYRISQAKELLHLTPDSIGQIGRRVGFSDPAYFSRVFRRIAGKSPSAYREHPDD